LFQQNETIMKILGFTEETTACDLCGRMELKGTYAIQAEDGSIHHLGSSCVKKRFGLTQKEFTSKKREAIELRREERRLFTLDIDRKFNEIYYKYPEASKYNPDSIGYDYLMAVLKERKQVYSEMERLLPSITKL